MKHMTNLQELYDREIFEAPALTKEEVEAASAMSSEAFETPISGDRMAQIGLK